ncbi:MAG: PQQ-like beta-propeller repeat protein [Planctomycetes bacterium]|nr:PQQ-like beta-propeller repeat protein [Planctomycetota bacterium]
MTARSQGSIAAVAALAALAAAGGAPAAPPEGGAEGSFESLGVPVRTGGLMGCIVGPDGRGGEALYFNFNQSGAPLFMVQVDPDTGEACQFTAPQGPGAWAFTLGPDGRIYLGTWDGALILRFDPREPGKGIEVLGKPSATESYIWQYAVGTDGKPYGCTYPGAKLVRFDPATGGMEDLGRMSESEMYARSVAAGADGKVYVGIGTQRADVVAYDPATGRRRSLLAEALREKASPGTAQVMRGADGRVYAHAGGGIGWMLIDGEALAPVEAPPEAPPLRLRDGRAVTAHGRGTFTLKDPATGKTVERTFRYEGAGDPIFVLGLGPEGCVYGSTAMPLEVFRHDPRSGRSEHLGGMPGGEVYSFLEREGKLYMCYYGGSVMNLYDPAKPYWRWGSAADSNPISFGGVGDGHLRPRAMVHGPDGMVLVGSEPPYGQLGGAMAVWDPRSNVTIENYRHLVRDQSIVSLAYEPRSGLVFGGSGNYGGGGTRPAAKEAVFFAFDPRRKQKVLEATLVPGAVKYPATCAAAGMVFTTAGDKLFAFDPEAMKVTATADLPGTQVDVSLGLHENGKLYGLTSSAVYSVDPASAKVSIEARAPRRVSCGFALTRDAVYFGSGVELWRWRLPQDPPPAGKHPR